jgi:exodeoxyribonuclease-3
MKIATWNVNSLRVRLDHVLEWLELAQPDVLALQETKLKDEDFPAEAFTALGYQAVYSGQPTYNGVALITREAVADPVTDIEGLSDPQRRVLGATVGETRIFNLYVPNGQSVDSDKYRYKLEWLEALRVQLSRELERHARCILLGDFNIAPEDRDVHDPDAWRGKVLCSDAERAALGGLLELGFADLFRRFEQPEKSYSWWDYRAAAFRRNMGLRIDLILASEPLTALCTSCAIDVEPRRLERPSDHTPVVAEFAT